MWHLKTPPKLRIFFWKTLHNALAMMAALYQRHSTSLPFCPICHSQEETVKHIILLYLLVKNICFGGILNYKVNRAEITTWPNWLLAIIWACDQSKDDRDRILNWVAFSCWYILKARCAFLFQQINYSFAGDDCNFHTGKSFWRGFVQTLGHFDSRQFAATSTSLAFVGSMADAMLFIC